MNDDPIIQEVRRIRQEHAAKFDYDPEAIFADLKRTERARDSRESPLLPLPESSETAPTPALHRTMGALRRAGRR